MTFDEWKQKNYKQWNTEQAYMIASQGTPEEENAIDRYSKMIWEASQPKWTYCKDGMPEEDIDSLVLQHNSFQPLNLLVEDKFNGEIRVVQGVYHFRIPCFATDDGEVIVHDGIAENDELKVLAWMPLPEVEA